MIAQLIAELRASSALEAGGALLGVAYVVLIMRRQRLGWIAGVASSAIYVYLAFQARLPMQSFLQVWYVALGVYGWFRWKRNAEQEGGRIRSGSLARQLPALGAIVILSALSARYLASETQAAWPWLDSLTSWTSLYATWLVTRMQLENWLYWIVNDLLTVFLFGAQGHPLTALLYLVFCTVACFGYVSWQRQYQSQTS